MDTVVKFVVDTVVILAGGSLAIIIVVVMSALGYYVVREVLDEIKKGK